MFRTMFLRHLHYGYHVRPRVWVTAAATVILTASYLSLSSMLVQVSTPPAVAVAAPKPSPRTGSALPTTTANTANITPACTPSAFSAPSALDLTNAAPGPTIQYESNVPYQIYGNTAAQLANQISLCAPRTDGAALAEFTGETAYVLSWQYTTAVSDAGCQPTNIKVGMHIATVLPSWQPTTTASSALQAKWQRFMLALSTHEAGHAALDRQYTITLTHDLNSLPAMNCANIQSAILNIVNRDTAALNQANDTYDTVTNHGASQGAVIPE